MRVLLTGAGGQLGRELRRTCPAEVALVAHDRPALDVSRAERVEAAFAEAAPEVVINTAAYTAVDSAEDDREGAFAINAEGAAHVARVAAASDVRIVHLSTDFVFDGRQGRPYAIDDPPHPLSAYGESKLEGERRVLEIAGERAVVLRTAWLYSASPGNFVMAMLERLRSGEALAGAVDQIGAPTWTRSLATAIWRAVARPEVSGIHHWTDAGVASRYDLTVAIQEEAERLGLAAAPRPVEPVAASRFPAAAARPAFSVLELGPTRRALGLDPIHWQRSLRSMLAEIAAEGAAAARERR